MTGYCKFHFYSKWQKWLKSMKRHLLFFSRHKLKMHICRSQRTGIGKSWSGSIFSNKKSANVGGWLCVHPLQNTIQDHGTQTKNATWSLLFWNPWSCISSNQTKKYILIKSDIPRFWMICHVICAMQINLIKYGETRIFQ